MIQFKCCNKLSLSLSHLKRKSIFQSKVLPLRGGMTTGNPPNLHLSAQCNCSDKKLYTRRLRCFWTTLWILSSIHPSIHPLKTYYVISIVKKTSSYFPKSYMKDKVKVTQSCLTLCDPVDCSPPGSSVHGILQARILEWVAYHFSRGSSQHRDQTQVSHIAGEFFII